MPYNNTAIPPSEEITGAATLPLARVKKILAVDEDLGAVSANAAFAITIATEMFIRYFADSAMDFVKAEKKPRRNLQYKDLANAVSRIDNLQFLEDVVPKTTTYREFKARRARAAHENGTPLPNGQTTLDRTGPRTLPRLQPMPESDHQLHQQQDVVMTEVAANSNSNDNNNVQAPTESSVPPPPLPPPPPSTIASASTISAHPELQARSNGQPLIFEHYEPNGTTRRWEPRDVEMSG